VLELTPAAGQVVARVPAGNVYVDGLSVGDVGPVVLRDRQVLARDGVVVVIVPLDKQTGRLVGRPDVVSLGFVEMEQSHALVEDTRQLVEELVGHHRGALARGGGLRTQLKEALGKFYYQRTRRRPIVLPFTMEV